MPLAILTTLAITGERMQQRSFLLEPLDADVFPTWARNDHEWEKHFEVSRQVGLSSEEVEKRGKIYGYNELDSHKGPSFWRLILDQFNDTLVLIFLVAAFVSFVLAVIDGDETGDNVMKFADPLLMPELEFGIVGVWQENNTEKALEALQEIQSELAVVNSVMASGFQTYWLRSLFLEIVEVKAGDKVPADMCTLELISSTLRVEQGSLTGQSEAVSKTNKSVPIDADIQGKKCMLFAGTTVVIGPCICLVTQTAMQTELGKVHSQIHIASRVEDDTPLKKELNEFGVALTTMIQVICAVVWAINVKYFLSWEYVDGWPRNFKFSFEKCTYYFEIAVALAVATIPKGLPAVMTTCLALGTHNRAEKNALVRKLPSVETLGCTIVICSGKTGTLTTSQMAVAKFVAVGDALHILRSFKVDGTTYDPFDGEIHETNQMDANLLMIGKISAVCNDASTAHSESEYIASGMPIEAALKVAAENGMK
ncbi:hypothetical protein Cgig2_004541 [Carnegiea gigantea]|uniref:Cation-transporting P-type ATPase N-terminal domain-containing protein n=1 Tax=Carnegiea gigantea TaxID=171969 RepID=A0A9Q1K6V8_9CARY|nr:hypothetical protein Cgig2_004541 [Carnegiea gigantea]